MIQLTTENFDETIQSSKVPVLVDFWASWCVPCKQQAMILEEFVGEYGENLLIASVNVKENQALMKRFEIISIPNLLLFRDGQQIGQIIGSLAKAELKNRLDNYLK